jgi:hypothetical protein
MTFAFEDEASAKSDDGIFMKRSESSKSNLETPVGILAEFRNGSPSMEGSKISPLAQIAGERGRARTGILALSLALLWKSILLSGAGSEISDYACRRRGADGRGATRLEFTQSMVQTFD